MWATLRGTLSPSIPLYPLSTPCILYDTMLEGQGPIDMSRYIKAYRLYVFLYQIPVDSFEYCCILSYIGSAKSHKPQGARRPTIMISANITASEVFYEMGTLSANTWLWLSEPANLAYVNKPMTLFGSSTKVEKGSDKRETYIMYLQPAAKVARDTLCPGAEAAGCEEACLISSGQLGMTTAQRAATKRTIIMLLRPQGFAQQILLEVDKAERRAAMKGTPALFRLNGTSDIDFSDIISERPHSQFYDYTKVLSRIRKNDLVNYHLTFSGSMYSPASRSALAKAVIRHHNIAVAFNTKGLDSDNIAIPATLADFDSSDLRPLDVPGAIGALKRKGSTKAQRALEGASSFFVTAANVQDFNDILARSV